MTTGENKLAIFDSANGKSITYTYIIEETDNGKLQLGTNENYVGTVYNEDGYEAELTNIEQLEVEREIQADNIAPEVEKIEVISQEGEYKTNNEIQIKVTFNEKIYTAKNKIPLVTATAPNLNISFGEGEIRNPSVVEISNIENYIIYQYKITSEDRGTLKIDATKAFDGTKTICDQLGNEVNLVKGKELEGSIITANNNLTQITLDKNEITLDLNGVATTTITASVNSTEENLIWESSNESVVTINSETQEIATITAIGIGEATISVKTSDGTTAICKITVKDTTKGITKVELNKTKLELDLNGTKEDNLIATVTQLDELAITWSSTNEEVVTVDDKGRVTAISTGEAQIIAKAIDGTTSICEIKVINSGVNEIEPTEIELNIKNIKVILGRTKNIQLKTTITPSNSNKNTKISYESSDEEIATVDENGEVTIKGKGTVVIIATSGNDKKAYCSIEIVEDSELSNRNIGDINSDNKVDTTDLLTILRHIAVSSSSKISQKHQDWILEGDKYLLADINGNGVIDVTDSLKLQRHIVASKNEAVKEKHPDWIIERLANI